MSKKLIITLFLLTITQAAFAYLVQCPGTDDFEPSYTYESWPIGSLVRDWTLKNNKKSEGWKMNSLWGAITLSNDISVLSATRNYVHISEKTQKPHCTLTLADGSTIKTYSKNKANMDTLNPNYFSAQKAHTESGFRIMPGDGTYQYHQSYPAKHICTDQPVNNATNHCQWEWQY